MHWDTFKQDNYSTVGGMDGWMDERCLRPLFCTIKAELGLGQAGLTQWEGMGDVGSARYESALLPPYPTIRVLSYSNCQRSIHSISK